MKFLTICEGGNVRSVSLGWALKSQGEDAVACSWRFNSVETIRMLVRWADFVIVMQPEFIDRLRERKVKVPKGKLRCVDVGPDAYGNPFHENLLPGLCEMVNDWKIREFAI